MAERRRRRDRASGDGVQLVAGVDEAGRGPLAGPVMAAAVILDPARPIAGLGDSKALSAAQRERLAPLIRLHATAWGLGIADCARSTRSGRIPLPAPCPLTRAPGRAAWNARDQDRKTGEEERLRLLLNSRILR